MDRNHVRRLKLSLPLGHEWKRMAEPGRDAAAASPRSTSPGVISKGSGIASIWDRVLQSSPRVSLSTATGAAIACIQPGPYYAEKDCDVHNRMVSLEKKGKKKKVFSLSNNYCYPQNF